MTKFLDWRILVIVVIAAAAAGLRWGLAPRAEPVRHYTERTSPPPAESPLPAMAMPSGSPLPSFEKPDDLAWSTPAGWTEQPASGMRAGSFSVRSGDLVADGSIVVLGGAAGGLLPNVKRWMGQLQMPLPADDELGTFLAAQPPLATEGGHEGVFIDFTLLGGGRGAAGDSMLVGMISRGESSVFVKLSGPYDLVVKERERFLELCTSLK